MIEPRAFKAAVGRFATGVTVVTTATEETVHGMTANAFASVSLDPPLVLVCISRGAWMHDLLIHAETFAVNVLSEGQADLASWFARPDRPLGPDQFEGIEWRAAPTSRAPLLAGVVAAFDCSVHDVLPGGDHAVVLGRVTSLEWPSDAPPLLYYQGRYGRWSPAHPGQHDG